MIVPPPTPPPVEIHGDLRVQADPDSGAEVRLRARPVAEPISEVSVHAIADGTVTLGGDEPVAGSIVGAWGEVHTPFGDLSLGRMPIPKWGLGLVADPGGCLDCVGDDTVDRASFVTELVRHNVGVSWDLGPERLQTATLMLGWLPTDLQRRRALDAGRAVLGYGTWSTWATRAEDELSVGLADAWARVEYGELRVEAEGTYVRGVIGAPVFADPTIALPELGVLAGGGAAQVQLYWGQVEVGAASGDPAPGLGLDPEAQIALPRDVLFSSFLVSRHHTIDRIQWRRDAGALTDVAWVRPSLEVPVGDALQVTGWGAWTTRLVDDVALEPEVGITGVWDAWRGLQLRGDVAVLLGVEAYAEGYAAWLF